VLRYVWQLKLVKHLSLCIVRLHAFNAILALSTVLGIASG